MLIPIKMENYKRKIVSFVQWLRVARLILILCQIVVSRFKCTKKFGFSTKKQCCSKFSAFLFDIHFVVCLLFNGKMKKMPILHTKYCYLRHFHAKWHIMRSEITTDFVWFIFLLLFLFFLLRMGFFSRVDHCRCGMLPVLSSMGPYFVDFAKRNRRKRRKTMCMCLWRSGLFQCLLYN